MIDRYYEKINIPDGEGRCCKKCGAVLSDTPMGYITYEITQYCSGQMISTDLLLPAMCGGEITHDEHYFVEDFRDYPYFDCKCGEQNIVE